MSHKPGTTPNSANLNNGPVKRATEISHVSPKTAKPVPVTSSGDTVMTHLNGFPVQPKPAIQGEDKDTQRVTRALQHGSNSEDDNCTGLCGNTPVTTTPEPTMQTGINGMPVQTTPTPGGHGRAQAHAQATLRKHGVEKGRTPR